MGAGIFSRDWKKLDMGAWGGGGGVEGGEVRGGGGGGGGGGEKGGMGWSCDLGCSREGFMNDKKPGLFSAGGGGGNFSLLYSKRNFSLSNSSKPCGKSSSSMSW